MLKLLIVQCLILSVTCGTLDYVLSETNEILGKLGDYSKFSVGELGSMVKRSVGLYEESRNVNKRSLDDKSTLIRDEEGVYLLENVEKSATVPSRFPNDVVLAYEEETLLCFALEGNQTTSNLSNELVIYNYLSHTGYQRIANAVVQGASSLSVQNIEDGILIASAEYNSHENVQPFPGSKVYKLNFHNLQLEEVQIIDVFYQMDLKFLQHLDQIYLIIAAENPEKNSSDFVIFKWLGRHFDRIQNIPTDRTGTVTPFTIGSFMYLAVANHEDAHGNTDINSEIYKFHLQDNKFKLFQKIPTQGARDVKYFKLKDLSKGVEEHFLIYANYFSKVEGKFKIYSIVYKYVNDYFVPFQSFMLKGVREWVPVTGSDGEFLILAVCEDGIFGYQYDGWRFVNVEVSLPFGEKGDVKSVRANYFVGNFYITVADKTNNGSSPNVWRLKFVKENDLKERYQKFEAWCDEIILKMSETDIDSVSFKEIVEVEPDSINFKLPVHFHNLTVENLKTEEFGTAGSDFIHEAKKLNADLQEPKSSLQEIKESLGNIKNGSDYLEIDGPLHIPYLELKCRDLDSCSFDNLHVKKLNGEDWDVFSKNIIDLNEDVELESLEFKNLTVENFSSKFLNGYEVGTLIDVNSEHILNTNLTVNGTVVIHGELILKGLLDGVIVDEENVLLRKNNQNFTKKFIFNSTIIENLELFGQLNGHDLEKLLDTQPAADLGDTFTDLNVHKLYVDGLISGFNISDLKNNVLRRSGDQKIEGDVIISNLTADEVIVDSNILSGKNLSKLIQISNNQNYTLQGDLIFEQGELVVNNLVVDKIRSIPIRDFEGKSSSEPDGLLPNILNVENLTVKDVRCSQRNLSLLEIFENALKLTETVVDSNLEFLNVEAEDLIVEKINDEDVGSWVWNDETEEQLIEGEKIFEKDVWILEKAHVKSVDGVDVEELERSAFKLDGEQNVTGNLVFETVKCKNLGSKSVRFGSSNLTNLIKSTKIIYINGSMTADELDAQNLNVSETVDGISWDDMLNDSIFKNQNPNARITGEKILYVPFQAKNLNINGSLNGYTPQEFFQDESQSSAIIFGPIFSNRTLSVDNLIFEDSLNSIKSEDFGNEWLLTDGDQNITAPMIFKTVKLLSGATLKNKIVNKVNITRLFEDTLKIDEDADIKSLQVMSEIRTKDVKVDGTVNGAKFKDSVIFSKSKEPQRLKGDWIFNYDLIINGSFTIKKFINGLNSTHLCSLNLDDDEREINVIVGGSAKFEAEPQIKETVNGVNLSNVLEKTWLKNEPTVLTGNAKFSNMTLHDKINLKGLLNNVNLTNLSKNYFNKKTTRVVPANLQFNNILITDTVKIKNLTVDGLINGLDLKKFSENILLKDGDQIITGKIRFNKLKVENLNGTVNGLDLNKDVLRYDVENAVVTGEKKFENLVVRYLEMGENSLQGVRIVDWKKKAAMVDGNLTIEGDLTFSEIKAGKIHVKGNVNDIKFNSANLLTTKGDQIVTGKKYFDLAKYPNSTLNFKTLKVSGLVGGVDLNNLIQNQANKNQDLKFTKKLNFVNGLKAEELEIEGLFQDVNISKVFEEISTNSTEIGELDEKFGRLVNESRKIKNLMDGRPYFLDHFELVQTVGTNVVALMPLSFDKNGELSLCTFTDDSRMDILKWDSFTKKFIADDKGVDINMTFVAPEITSDKFYLYIETPNKTLLLDSDETTIEIQANDTSCITSFDIKQLNKSCLFVGQKWANSKLLCNSTVITDLQTYQELEAWGSVGASALNIDDDVFIAVINKEKVNVKFENALHIYQYDQKLYHFEKVQTLLETNPIAVSTVSYKDHHYLVSASRHLPSSVQSNVLAIFRFDSFGGVFLRYQSIKVDTPIDVKLVVLPSSELVLYVLTANLEKPLVVFAHKGIEGFVEETSGLVLHPGSKLYSVTDKRNEHFLIISGYGNENRGQILKASFKGNKN